MDPASAILTALIAGAIAGTTQVATSAVKDAYAVLRKALVETYKFASVALLEKDPKNEAFRNAAQAELSSSQVTNDPATLEKAKEVLDAAAKAPPEGLVGYAIDVDKIHAGRDALFERIAGIRAKNIEAGQDITFRDISGADRKN